VTFAERSSKPAKHRATAILLGLILCGIGAAVIFGVSNWMALAKARKVKNPLAATPAALAEGKQVYAKHCENCHGENGDGKGQKAPELSTAPTDFTKASNMDGRTDGEFFYRITKGRRPMPAFEDKLTETERWEVVDYIRTLERKPDASSSVPSSSDSTPTQ
jgi:mono/diheme cytochrome c family protein